MSKSILKTATVAELSAGRVRAILGLAIITALISTGLFARVQAYGFDERPEAAGDLDPSFGAGGKVVANFPVETLANGIVIQGDGKLVVAGRAQQPTGAVGTNDFGVARYSPDGSLDTSFGDGGGVSTDFFGGDDRATAVALQSDGKIVAGGTASTAMGGYDFALARYNSNGTLDASFGSGGKVTTDFSGGEDEILAIVIQPDGTIVAVGQRTMADGNVSAGIALYHPDGSLAAKGGTGGGVEARWATSLALEPDGQYLIGGVPSGPPSQRDAFELIRMNSNGVHDQGFGNGGYVTTDFGGIDDLNAIVLQPDGKIVAAGTTVQGNIHAFALARYNTDGSLDSSFGSGGKVITDSLGKPAVANAVLIQQDHKIIAVGFSRPGASGSSFTVVRYNADGSLDGTFGSGGQVTTAFLGGDNQARAALIQPDGKIVAAGLTSQNPGGPRQVAIARYLSGAAPGFSISVDQPTVTAQRGTKARVTVLINRTGGFTGNVTVTPPDPSDGIRPKPPSPITTPDSFVVFKMKIGGGAAVGPQQFTFTAKDDSGKTQTAVVTIVVQ